MASMLLLASCTADLVSLEKLAMHDASTSQKLANLIRSRSAEQKAQPEKDATILSYWDSLGSIECSQDFEPEGIRMAMFHAATELIPVLVRDNTVLESNCRSYEAALDSALEELLRLRVDAAEFETLMSQTKPINDFLNDEHLAQGIIGKEEMRLAARHEQLIALLQAAASSKDGERSDVLLKALAHENSVLRSMLFSCRFAGEGITTDSPFHQECTSSSRRSDDHRPSPCSPSPGSPIEFPLPPMPPPSPPSKHREVASWKRTKIGPAGRWSMVCFRSTIIILQESTNPCIFDHIWFIDLISRCIYTYYMPLWIIPI